MKKYRINDVAIRVGLSQKRIREYEKARLIKPERAPNTNNRIYSESDIRQIERIKELIHKHGFTVACIRHFLGIAPCWTIFKCPDKESCPAFQSPHTPCYDTLAANPLGSQGCDECAVYLNRDPQEFAILHKIRP